MRLILASSSPRRIQLLEQIGLSAKVHPSTLPEVVSSANPREVVKQLSRQKAEDIAAKIRDGRIAWKEDEDTARAGDALIAGPGTVSESKELDAVGNWAVIGADTVVAVDDQILGKPKSHEEAYGMIHSLQGRMHQVYTGVTVVTSEKTVTFVEKTEVEVAPMTKQEIRSYADSAEPMDKAGGYGIQGLFGRYVTGIHGDYNNIVGLPVAHLYQVLKELDS